MTRDGFQNDRWTVRAPWAVRPPFNLKTHQRPKTSLVILLSDRRTVHAPGADRPPFNLKSHQRSKTSLVILLSDRRTVRALGPDRPPFNLSDLARETTSLDDFFKIHVTVRSTVFKPKQSCNLFGQMSYTGGPFARHFFFSQVDQHQLQDLLLCKCANNTK